MIDPCRLEQIIAKTREWEYRTRGTEPGEVDCVGWVIFILRELGFDLPDYNYQPGAAGAAVFYAEYHKYADPVERSRIAPGDIVFCQSESGGQAHLALYVGGNRIAHCTRGNGVIRQRLDQPPLSRMRLSFYRMKPHA